MEDRAWVVHWTAEYIYPTDDPRPYISGIVVIIGDHTEEGAIAQVEEEFTYEHGDCSLVSIQATFWDDLLEAVEAQLLDEVG